jgi:lipopolysaccharide transport system ATP-binding protein
MSSEIALHLEEVSKCFQMYARPQDRLKQMIVGRRKKYFREFWALKDISFNVERGACIGIIGRNGAGKSTLLQIISGVMTPSSGNVTVNGRVAALLELGTGFNPEFSGKENVYLNGSILGLSRSEIDARYDRIAAFADIGEFLDQPVKTYSSGMFVRLAFAVATHVDPDILVIDEALAVGDAKFQSKCFRKFEEFRKEGKTILFVSHATEQIVRHCDWALLIEHGEIIKRGEPKMVANEYLNLLFGINPVAKKAEPAKEAAAPAEPAKTFGSAPLTGSPEVPVAGHDGDGELKNFIATVESQDRFVSRAGYNKAEFRWGTKHAEIVDYLFGNQDHWHLNHFAATDEVNLYLKVKYHKDVAYPIYGLTIKTPDGVTVYGTNSRDWDSKNNFEARRAGEQVIVKFSFKPDLITGHYLISLGVAEQGTEEAVPLDRRYDALEIYVTNTNRSFGIADLHLQFAQGAALPQAGVRT